MKYSATSRLGEGVEMSKQLSQQTGRPCSSSYGLVLSIKRNVFVIIFLFSTRPPTGKLGSVSVCVILFYTVFRPEGKKSSKYGDLIFGEEKIFPQ